ncbi:MAG: FAD:protein FMN transferase [Alphaproteobacteria bacterium]
MVERAKPLLGTFVSVRVTGASEEVVAHRAIDAAFQEIALIHTLMSFHEPQSDVSRLNRDAHKRPIEVHPYTHEVLQLAHEMMIASGGCFDITVAPELVRNNLLPSPAIHVPHDDASGRDIELLDDECVRFLKPLWIDLGGIAKGYAIDRAVEALLAHGIKHAVVNAGGDLRAIGEASEPIELRPLFGSSAHTSLLNLQDASVASSEASLEHRDGRRREQGLTPRFVSVVARSCALADALTKPVIALGAASASLLQKFGAIAFMHEPGGEWLRLGDISC